MNRRIGLVAAAIVLALIGTLAVYSYAHNADKRAVARTRAASVLITQKRVPAGTSWQDAIKGGYFKQEKIPVDSAPSNALSSLDASVPIDDVANADIAAGQVVVRPMFGSQSAVTGALPIPKGDIAVSVSLAQNAAAAGYIQYQSQVAVFGTYKLQKLPGEAAASGQVGNDNNLYTTKLLLPRVTVIATSQQAPTAVNGKGDTNNNGGNGNVLITLALNQQQAEKLILSQQVGQLYLALLSNDSVTADDPGALSAGIFSPTPIFLK